MGSESRKAWSLRYLGGGLYLMAMIGCSPSSPAREAGLGGSLGGQGASPSSAGGGGSASPGSGGSSGPLATGGSSQTGGSAGGSTINCALVGCAAPPMCATGCTETCGCCSCAEGIRQGDLVCQGGCWAVPDAGVDFGLGAGEFESFRLTQSSGPCPPESDCVGYIDLDRSGQLLRDPVSNPGAPVGSASITPTELASAIAVFTDAALIELLDASSPPCVPPTDIFETMKLTAVGVTHENSTTMCDNAPVKAARDLIYQLGDKYLPLSTR
jgi:hypothetical protein